MNRLKKNYITQEELQPFVQILFLYAFHAMTNVFEAIFYVSPVLYSLNVSDFKLIGSFM